MDMNKHGMPSPRGFEIPTNMHPVPNLPSENQPPPIPHESGSRTTLPQISTSLDLINAKKPMEQDKTNQPISAPTHQNGTQQLPPNPIKMGNAGPVPLPRTSI